ncbi:MAG: antibiotic biosynthesis monooxygenase [Flavobacteriales bacterium]|nr:antibiotic biosynthesis monooxygenase [Flavobacteriales bacterium]
MITRIVKLTILPEKMDEFERIFVKNQNHISNFPGCYGVKVLQEINYPNIYFTYSTWESEEAINNYRKSDLFGSIWPNTKKLFLAKPEAWSLR